MFNGFKDPSNCYNNQPLFENCNQPPFLPCEGTKQTSAPPWDYSSQSYNNVPFYPNDQHLNHRLPPPIIHNPPVLPPQFERKETSHSINNNNVLVHYPNSSNSHQSVVRPTALINCQSRGNLCCNHPGRIAHWGSSVDSVRFLGNPSLTKDIPSFSQTFLHDEARFRPTDNFATSLNKLSKFPRDASANHGSVAPKGVKKSVTSPVENCSSRLQPSHDEVSEKFPHNKSTKKESCLSCQDDCRSSCRMYDHQAVIPEFANLDTVSQDIPHSVTTTRENVVRYSGHSSVSNGAMTQPCNQWPSNSHSQPDMWIPNNHPNIWMPPDGMRLPNNGPPPGFWMERNGGTTQLPSYQEVVQYKSHGPVEKKRLQDQVRYCETQRKSAGELSRYDEGLPKKNDEVLQDKYPGMTKYSDSQRKNQEMYGRCPDNTRYHNVRADPSHLLKHQDVSKELESMCHKVPTEVPETSKHSGAVISHTSVAAPYGIAQDTFPSPETGRRYGDSNLNNIHNGRTNYAPYPRNRPSENYTTGIAQPPSRFSPQMTYTQSKISRSSNDLLLSHQCSESFTAPLTADCNLSGNNFSSLTCHNSPVSMVEKASNQYNANNDIVVDFTVSSVHSKNTTDVIRYSASKDPGNIYNLPGLEPCNKMPDDIVYGKTMQVVDSYHVDKRDIKSSGSYAASKSHPLACNSYQSIQNRNETEYNLFYNNIPPHFENNGANMNTMPLNSGVRERNLISSVVPNDGSTDVFNLSDDCTADRVDRPIKKRKSRFKGPVKEERYCVSQSLKRWTRNNNQGSGEPVLDVRQFLATWDEESEDLTTSPKLPDVILSENNPSLYVVDSNHLESASENHNSSLVPVYEQLNEPIHVPVSDVNIDFELSKNDANYKTSNVTTKDEEAKSLGLVAAAVVHDSIRSSNNSPLSQSSVTVDAVESHAAKKVLKNEESNSPCIADGVLSPPTSSSVATVNKASNKISEKSFTMNSCPLESMITSDVDISSNGNQLKENSSKSSDLTDEPDCESRYAHVSVSDKHKLKTNAVCVMAQSPESNSDCVIKPCDKTMSEDADICLSGPVKETGCVDDKLASPEEKPSSGASMPDISNAPLKSVNEDEQVMAEDRKDLPVLETATPVPGVAADQEVIIKQHAPKVLQLNKENLNESKIKFCSNQQGNLNKKNCHMRINMCSGSDDLTSVKDCNYEEKVAEVINYKSTNCDNANDTSIFEPANTSSHSTCSPPRSYSPLPKAEENSPCENSQTSPLVDTEDGIIMSNLVDKLQNAINGQAYKERGCSSNATVERHKSVKHKFDSRCTTPDSVSIVSTPSYADTREDFDFESGMSSYEDEELSNFSLMKKQNISTDFTSIGKEMTHEISKPCEGISESAVTLNHASLDNSFIKPNITVSSVGETSCINEQLTSKFKECNELSENKSVVSTVQDSVSLHSNDSGCDSLVTDHFGIVDFNDQRDENVSSPPSSPVTQLITCGGSKRAVDSPSEEYLPLLTDGSSTVSHLNTLEAELCNHSSQQSDTCSSRETSDQEGNHTGKCNLLEENTASNLELPQNIHVQDRSSDEFKNLESSDNQNDPSECNSVETQKDNQIVIKSVKEEIICGGVDRVEENKIFSSNLQNSETVKDESYRPTSERTGASGSISLTSMESLDNGQPLLLSSPNCIKYPVIPGAEENLFCDSAKDHVDVHKLADMNVIYSGRKSKQHEDLLQDNSEDFDVCVIPGEELQGIVKQSSDCTVELVESCDVEDDGQVSGRGDRAIISTEEKANQQEDRPQENDEDYNSYTDVAINPKDVDSVHSNAKRLEMKTDLDTCEENSSIETDVDQKCNKLPNSKIMSDARTSPSSAHKEQSSVYAFESQLLDEQKPSHCENSNEVVDNESEDTFVGVLPSLETSNKSSPATDLMLSSSGDKGSESKHLETERCESFNAAVENNCLDGFNDNKFEIFNSSDSVKKSEQEPTSTEMSASENVDNNDYKDASTPKEEYKRTSSISPEICEIIGNSENLDATVKDYNVEGMASFDIKCTSGLEFCEDKLFSNQMCHVKNNNCAGLKSEKNELCCEVTAEDSNKQGLETHVEQHFKGYESESLIEQRADDTTPSNHGSNFFSSNPSTAIKHIPENENILGNSSHNLSTESSINHSIQEESTEPSLNHSTQQERTESSINHSTQEERTGSSINHSTQVESTESSLNHSTQEERTGSSINHSTQEESTESSLNDSTQEERTESSINHSTREESTESCINHSTQEESTESSINHSTQEKSTESSVVHSTQEEQVIPIGDPSSEVVITAEDSIPCLEVMSVGEEMPHLEVSSEVVPDDSENLEMPCLEAMSDTVCVVTELNESSIPEVVLSVGEPDIPSREIDISAPVTVLQCDKSYDNMEPIAGNSNLGLGMTENQNSGNCEDNTVSVDEEEHREVNGAKDINGNCTFKNDETLVIKSGETQEHNSSPVEENHGTLLVRDEVTDDYSTPTVDNETDLQISQHVLHTNHYDTQPDATDVPFVASDPDISINSSIVEVLPADLVSNWPYVEEEVFAETPTANTELTEVEVNSSTHDSMAEVERGKSTAVVNNSSVSSLPVNSSSKENVEKFNLAAGGLKCRLSWKKIFDLSKFSERKKVRVKEKKVTSQMLDGVASKKGDVDRKLLEKKNSRKGIIDGLELGPAKIEVRLAHKPFSKDQFKMWQVVDDPNNEKGGRWSCMKESNNNYISSDSHETREATGSTPIVLVRKLILKCRADGSGNSSSDHSECDARNSVDGSSPDCSRSNSDFDQDNPEDDLLQIRGTEAVSCPKTSIQETENSTKETIENIKDICATLNGNMPTKEQNENIKDISATLDENTPFSPLPSDCEDGQIHQSRLGDQSNLLSNEMYPVSPRYSSNDSYDSSTSQDSSTRGKQKQQLPRVIIKRTGCGTAKYRSFLRVSEADTSHWQPVVALQRNSFLDSLSRKIMQNGLAGKHVNVDSAALEKMGFITDVSKRKLSKLIENNPLKLQDDFTKMKTESRKQCDSKDKDTVKKADCSYVVEKHSKELKQTFQNEKRKGIEEDKSVKSKCYKDRRLDKDIKTSRKGSDGSPKKNKESYVNVRGDFYTKDNCAEDNSLVARENSSVETRQSDDVKSDEQCFNSDGAVCDINQSESKEGEMFDIETEIKSSIIQKKISKDCPFNFDQNRKGLGSSTTEQTGCSVVVGSENVCRKRNWQESQASDSDSAPGGEQCSDTKKKCNGFSKNNSHSLCPESEGDEVVSKRAEVKDSDVKDGACRACGWIFGDRAERAAHVRQHPYHCQRCHLAFKSEVDFVSHLSSEHPSTREQHHCLLCERSFTTAAKHRLHLSGRLHRQLEATQRRTIHTIFTILTGHNCPGISPLTESEMASLRWFPSEPGAVHFYHQATPLQMAVQDWTIRQREANHAGSKPPSEETEVGLPP